MKTVKKISLISALIVLVSLAAFLGHLKFGGYGFYSG